MEREMSRRIGAASSVMQILYLYHGEEGAELNGEAFDLLSSSLCGVEEKMDIMSDFCAIKMKNNAAADFVERAKEKHLECSNERPRLLGKH